MQSISFIKSIGMAAAAATLFCLPGGMAAADSYPSKAVQVVVPYNPGGDTDLLARVFAKEFEKALGQPVVIVNVAGASGSIATTKVKNSAPDGYTMLFHHSGVMVSMITEAIDFSFKDMEIAGSVARSEGMFWVTGANSPYQNINDLIKAAKAKPESVKNGLNFGSQTHTHLAAFERVAGVKLHNIDVGGTAEKIVAVLGGHIDVTEAAAGAVRNYLQAGQMRALGLPSANRFSVFPDVKTFKEQGLDLVVPDRLYWLGLPPHTPKEIVNTVSAALEKTSKNPAIKTDFEKILMTPYFKSAEETIAELDDEYKFMIEYKDVFKSKKKKKKKKK